MASVSSQVSFGLLASAVYVVLSFRKSKSSKKMSSVECTHEGGDCGHVTAAPAWRGPVAPKAAPVPKELAAGATAWLCTCGESKNYPLCDGSHRAYNAANNTTFAPRPYKNESAETVTAYLCACGKTQNPTGHCDGSHRK